MMESVSGQDCSKIENSKTEGDVEEIPENKRNMTPTEIPFTRKYSESLIKSVLKFSEKNSLTETARHFNIPHSTILAWQLSSLNPREDQETGDQDRLGTIKSEKVDLTSQQTDGQEENITGGEKEEELSWEMKEEVVDFVKKTKSYQQATKKYGYPAETIKEWAKMKKVANKAVKVVEEKPEVEKKRVREYSDQVKEAAVKYGKEHGWSAAAVKFNTSSTSVSRWATYFDPKSPWKLKVILAAQVVGTKEASKKFKVAQSTLEEWIRVSGKFCPNIEDFDTEAMDICGNYCKEEPEEAKESCNVCGEVLSRDETLLEHLVAQHLTGDGLCGVCGAESDDFETHFKIHFEETMEGLTDEEEEDVEDEDPMEVQEILKDLLVEG